ncbi:MAG: chromosome condensation protein CrcB, partial [Planctomycetes bacterium]|nr:chromosome condensation protein CrcB [Planctomycetota bacterium]
MWVKLLMLALAGAGGTLARYALQKPFEDWAMRVTGWAFPWGTLPINAAGCFAFGLVWALSE